MFKKIVIHIETAIKSDLLFTIVFLKESKQKQLKKTWASWSAVMRLFNQPISDVK